MSFEDPQLDKLVYKCFPEEDHVESKVTIKYNELENGKSFWSRVLRVELTWTELTGNNKHPTALFMKLPVVSKNATDSAGEDAINNLRETLKDLTKNEVRFYNTFGKEKIAQFPYPKFYFGQDMEDGKCGVLINEDLTNKVYSRDFIPGISILECYRIMEALAGFHHHLISRPDQSWVEDFDRTSTINTNFQNLQFSTAMKLEFDHPDLFCELISSLEPLYDVDFAKNAHSSYKNLGLPPVLCHFDLNATNMLWSKHNDELAAIIDFQLVHTGCLAEDIARVLCLSLTEEDRQKSTRNCLHHYYSAMQALFNGNTPFTFKQLHRAYQHIFLYTSAFSLFALCVFHDMYERQRETNPEENDKKMQCLIRRAHGVARQTHIYWDLQKKREAEGDHIEIPQPIEYAFPKFD